jgi:hypothetical protein
LDKNEIAALLESLCDRPFAADPHGPPVTDASAGESAPAPAPETPGAAAIQADDPGRAAADLASILSGTATPAQCQAFQQAAMRSIAVRLEAQSALAFLDRIDAAPLPAPAYLVAQTLASAGGAPPSSRPGIWSRLMCRPGRQVAAACAVMLMAGGVSWSLLRRGDLTADGVPAPPASSPQAVGPLKVIEPAPVALPRPLAPVLPASPAGSEFSTQSESPARPVAPLSATPLAQPAAPAFAPVPEPAPSLPLPAQALTDPCGPRSVVASETRARSKAEAKAAKRAPSQPPRVAAVEAPDPGCGVGVGAVEADQGPVPAAKPAARIGRSDRAAPVATAPAYAPAAPAKRPAANVPPR